MIILLILIILISRSTVPFQMSMNVVTNRKVWLWRLLFVCRLLKLYVTALLKLQCCPNLARLVSLLLYSHLYLICQPHPLICFYLSPQQSYHRSASICNANNLRIISDSRFPTKSLAGDLLTFAMCNHHRTICQWWKRLEKSPPFTSHKTKQVRMHKLLKCSTGISSLAFMPSLSATNEYNDAQIFYKLHLKCPTNCLTMI